MDKVKHSRIEILCRKIKKMVDENLEKGDLLLTESDAMKFIHEIEVQQLELEIQNEELIEAGEQKIIAARKYADLYDFAPSGYFTLSSRGIIKEINLSGGSMLGKERTSLINSHFGFFVSDDTRPDFNHFLSEIFISSF